MPADNFLTASDVLAFLDERRKVESIPADQEGLRTRYRQAAAVLAALDDPENLQPVGGAGRPHEAMRLLRDELVPAPGPRLAGRLMLDLESRRKALMELTSRQAATKALEANPGERTGPVQEELERYLVGSPKPLNQQPPETLDETLQVAVWLEGIVEGVPSPDDVRRRLAYQELMAPFEALAGDSIFRGRRRELDALRSFVGVLDPESLLARVRNRAIKWLEPAALPAVSISGPGGVGKSALIARFMLEHSRLPEAGRIPFAYLDFDRPTLSITEPTTLVAEMLYQLDLQFPQGERFGKLREFLRGELAKISDQTVTSKRFIDMAGSVLADMLGILGSTLGPRPYVVVLDTFEEVQYRGESRAYPVWELLARMQHRWPFLRVIVSGRSPVSTLTLVDQNPRQLPLEGLDPEAAKAFLRTQGVEDGELAAAIVRQVGGVPLSLKLAASVLKREGGDRQGVRGLSGRSWFWMSPTDEVIQGQLYERILSHIHNPRVERLAHPGLVLRRISPEVILHVLNGPCQLELKPDSITEAKELFEELSKETALVASDTLDGSLIHRADLRRMMLKLLVQKAPAQVKQIHRAAVDWYSTQRGWRARAEESYHRLQLGEAVQDDVLKDPEVRASLQASVAELPIAAQAQLAAFGFQVSEEILNQASLEQRESHAISRIEELLAYGEYAVEEAQSLLHSLQPLRPSGRLFRSAARVAAQQGDADRALRLIADGLKSAGLADDNLQTLELAGDKAWLLRNEKESPELRETLELLKEYSLRFDRPPAIFQQKVESYVLAPRQTTGGIQDSSLPEIARLFGRLTPLDVWNIFPTVGMIIDRLSGFSPAVTRDLQRNLLSGESPFLRAEFAEIRPRLALQKLVNQMSTTDELSATAIQAVLDLCKVWPYRILHVQPPYGRTGFDQAEAAALR